MLPKSKVDLYAAIRRDARTGMSLRAVMRKYGVGFETVQRALVSAVPEPRKKMRPRETRLDPYRPLIDAILTADLTAPRKQRHTVKRIYDRLLDEHDAVDVSYQMVRAYVAGRREEIRLQAGKGVVDAFVPQTHKPGAEAEVDFGDVTVKLAGELVTCYLFAFRLSYSGKAVHRIFASAGQEAFFEGHVHALNVLGGVPTGKVRYDNLRAAVAQVLGLSRRRVEAERWTAFRSHYWLEAFYCQPGIRGAHEKGGVEGQIGWFRRNHLVPVPEVDTLAELNAKIDRWDQEDDARRIRSRPRTIGEYFATEQPLLAPLPEDPFETGRLSTPRVDRYSQICVRMNRYSVPVRLIGRTVRVMLHASELVVYDGREEVARHERLIARGATRLELDHYLEALIRKPGALPGATALDQARAAGRFTPIHDAWWQAAVKAHGEREGTRALIEVLLLSRHLPHEHLITGLAAALKSGALTADAVALEARKAADAEPEEPAQPVVPGSQPGIAPLPAAVRARLPPDTRPLPSVAHYDQLLRLRRSDRPTP
ncbi:IS21 family transposase [Streptomyces sp. A1136]|uniref:IS21 family transposase n=1 Tax=Streptomyces sp. A1136 TaxID=2563102 RepID=UPI00109E64CD|nr:IS21 family transposase [Streptomyces sp. A1136]THA47828.1 IS21 family transposase [Streptomyces sp. A1136]